MNEPAAEVNRLTKEDFCLAFLLFPTFLVSLIGSILVIGIYGTPWVLGIANCEPRSAAEAAIETVLAIFSFLFNYVVYILSLKFLAFFLVNQSKFDRWQLGVQSISQQSNFLKNMFFSHISWALKPRAK